MRRMMMVAVIMLATAGQSVAQSRASESAGAVQVLGALSRCRVISDAGARLACYDKAGLELEKAVADRDLQILDHSDVRKARRSLFGLNLPDIAVIGGRTQRDQKDTESFAELNSTVRSARAGPNGRAEIVLMDEGAPVWQTSDPMNFPPRPGEKVRIRKGALGNYFIAVDGRSYRGLRLR